MKSVYLFGVVTMCLLLSACGGAPDNVATVTGKVTLDGQPLANALVTFTPKTGAVSFGRTNAEGVYELQYSREHKGAEIGQHTVSVSTYAEADPDGDPPVEGSPERVPVQFNQQSELIKDVASGANTHDLTLTSEGEIVQGDVGEEDE